MNLDKLFILFSIFDKENLDINAKYKNPLSKKIYINPNSKKAYVILPPLHTPSFYFLPLKKKIKQSGSSYIEYNFIPEILSPNVGLTCKYFKEITTTIKDDMLYYQKKYGINNYTIIGISLSCVTACMVANLNNLAKEIILVVPGSCLAESLWCGVRTQKFRKVMENNNITLNQLKKNWSELAPENNLAGMINKKIRIIISRDDQVIPYYLGKKLAERAKKLIPDTELIENDLGHYLSVIKFCFMTNIN